MAFTGLVTISDISSPEKMHINLFQDLQHVLKIDLEVITKHFSGNLNSLTEVCPKIIFGGCFIAHT